MPLRPFVADESLLGQARPPGTLVVLANHETAVIARRQPHRETGLNVPSFLAYRNQPLERPIHRDTPHSAFAIRRLTEPAPNWPAMRWETLGGTERSRELNSGLARRLDLTTSGVYLGEQVAQHAVAVREIARQLGRHHILEATADA